MNRTSTVHGECSQGTMECVSLEEVQLLTKTDLGIDSMFVDRSPICRLLINK